MRISVDPAMVNACDLALYRKANTPNFAAAVSVCVRGEDNENDNFWYWVRKTGSGKPFAAHNATKGGAMLVSVPETYVLDNGQGSDEPCPLSDLMVFLPFSGRWKAMRVMWQGGVFLAPTLSGR